MVEGRNIIAPLSAVAGAEFDAVRADCAKQVAELTTWYRTKLQVIWLSCVQGRDSSRMLDELPMVELALRGDPELPALMSLQEKVQHGLELAAAFQKLKAQWDLTACREVNEALAAIPEVPAEVEQPHLITDVLDFLAKQSAERKSVFDERARKTLKILFGSEDLSLEQIRTYCSIAQMVYCNIDRNCLGIWPFSSTTKSNQKVKRLYFKLRRRSTGWPSHR